MSVFKEKTIYSPSGKAEKSERRKALDSYIKNRKHLELGNSEDYVFAYRIGQTDLSSDTVQLKEALREIIKECEEWVITGAERSNNCESNHYIEIDALKTLIEKAKQLLNKE